MQGGLVTAARDGSIAQWQEAQQDITACYAAESEDEEGMPRLMQYASLGLACAVKICMGERAVFMAHADGRVTCWPMDTHED